MNAPAQQIYYHPVTKKQYLSLVFATGFYLLIKNRLIYRHIRYFA